MNWNPDIGIPLAIAGVLVLIAIAIFGRPRKPEQGRRTEPGKPRATGTARREPSLTTGQGDGANRDADPKISPVLPEVDKDDGPHLGWDGDPDPDLGLDEVSIQEELELLEDTLRPNVDPAESSLGRRNDVQPEHIVALYLMAKEGSTLDGASIVIAAEKAGLTYGHMGIFHRLVDGRPDAEPIFSVANLLQPGHFDLRNAQEIETPGLSFFMTLPGPVSALDAWETMLPTVERMAELLGANVLDEQRNALGRQRIAHIRDEMRTFDREQEKQSRRRW